MASWKRRAQRAKDRQAGPVTYSSRPPQAPAPGFYWVKIKGGPRDGEWVQVLRREYESK